MLQPVLPQMEEFRTVMRAESPESATSPTPALFAISTSSNKPSRFTDSSASMSIPAPGGELNRTLPEFVNLERRTVMPIPPTHENP
jgi:hypothetical protein